MASNTPPVRVFRGLISEVSCRDYFAGGSAVAGAADSPRRVENGPLVAERGIQLEDALRRLVGQHHRPLVLREHLRRRDLVLSVEPVLRVLGKLDVVRRVGVNEVIALERHLQEVTVLKVPARERRLVLGEVVAVGDPLVAAERHVELAAHVEAAKPVRSLPCRQPGAG